MRILQDASIRAKVLGAFSTVLAITIALGIFADNRLSAVNDKAAEIRDNFLVATRDLGIIASTSERFRQHHLQLLLSIDPTINESPAVTAGYRASLQKDVQERDAAWASYAKTVDPGDEQRLADDITENWAAYTALGDKFVNLVDSKQFAAAATLNSTTMKATFAKIRADLARDIEMNSAGGEDQANQGEAIFKSSRLWILVVSVFAAVISTAAGLALIVNVSSPIRRMTDAMAALAAHDLSTEIEGVGRKDEIGRMAAAVQVFKDSMIAADRLAEAQAAEQAVKERRTAALESLTRGFETKIGAMVAMLSSASTEMEAAAQSMSSTAGQTNQLSVSVVSASEQMSANVQTVATATEELASSIQEISRQVAQSAVISERAVERTRSTDQTVRALTESTEKVGNVVKLISSIASQTNLLALNATIEAARAGDAGKGFAVVAGEVKGLAGQTAKATIEITEQIDQIRDAADNVVVAIREISATILEINEIAAAIASAVEEQGAATQEIARNIQETAHGTQVVADNILQVKEASTETGAMATQVLGSAGELAQHSGELRAEVDRFLDGVKAA